MTPRLYLILVLTVAAALVCSVVAVNARVDPYGLRATANRDAAPDGVDGPNPGAFLRKAFAVRDARPRAVVLGTSRAEYGIDVRHPGFAAGDVPVMNLALGGSSIDQMRLLLVHANATSPVRLAIIGLDLESFLDAGRSDFDPAALDGNPESEPRRLVRLRADMSREALGSSVARLIGPGSGASSAGERAAPADSRRRGLSDEMLRRFQGQHGIVWVAEFGNFYSRLPYLFPRWPPGTRWDSDRRRAAAMAAFRELLAYARREDIELRMFISPVHARYLEWYQRVGWWPMFDAWKRELVDAIAAESIGSGRPPFTLWDFSGYHALATEAVPQLNDLSTRMRWYRDTSHYSPELGDLVLDRVLGRSSVGASALPDTRIDRANIERRLAEVQFAAGTYRQTQPDEAADVSDMLVYLRRVARK